MHQPSSDIHERCPVSGQDRNILPIPRSHSSGQISELLKAAVIILLVAGAILLVGEWGIIVVGVVVFTKLRIDTKIILFCISVLFPLGSGTAFGSIEIFLYHLMVPLILLSFATKKIPIGYKKMHPIAMIAGIGVFVLLIGLFISYLRNPVIARSLGGGEGTGYGIRSYLASIMCVIIYLISYTTGRNNLIKGEKLLKALLITALVIGFLRILTYFGMVEIPILRGSLRYLFYEGSLVDFTEHSRRIGGLDIVAGITVLSSFLLWDAKKSKYLAFIGFAAGIVFIVLGGGRAAFLGISFALLLGLIRRGPKVLLRVIIPTVLAYFIMTQTTFGGTRSVIESQQQRLFMYEQVFERQATRIESYTGLLDAWRENPVFGKGITPTVEGSAGIVDIGGHGSYFSLVGLFGLFGLTFVLATIAYPLFKGIRLLFRRSTFSYERVNKFLLARFTTLFFVFYAFILSIGGSGYADPVLFFIAGFLVALIEQSEIEGSRKSMKSDKKLIVGWS